MPSVSKTSKPVPKTSTKKAGSKTGSTKAAPQKSAAAKSELRNAFAKFDLNGDGVLTLPVLRAVLTRPGGGQPMADEQIQKLFKTMDVDGDGKVDLDEFSKSLASGEAKVLVDPVAALDNSSCRRRCSSCRSCTSRSRAASTSRPRPGATRRSARAGSWSTTRLPARS